MTYCQKQPTHSDINANPSGKNKFILLRDLFERCRKECCEFIVLSNGTKFESEVPDVATGGQI
jgi:hypothetical protein